MSAIPADTEATVDALETSHEDGMFRLAWWVPMAVLAPAWLVRLFRVAYVSNFIDDRTMNVPSAFNYMERGFLGPDNWWTQPAKHALLYWDLLVFGNDPVGWRMREVVFGTLAVLMVFLIARRFFRDVFPAVVAATLYGLDPLAIAFSRASSEDVPAVFFMLAGIFFWTRALEEDRFIDWLVTGALFGVAIALRVYILFVLAVVILVTMWLNRREDGARQAGLLAHLIAVPAIGYLVWWIPWLAAGHDLGDLWLLHVDTFLLQMTGVFPQFDPEILSLAGAAGWFTRWIGAGYAIPVGEGAKEYTVMMNDPAIWLFFIPSVALLLWEAFRVRSAYFASAGAFFVVLCAFFIGVPREVLIYSALALIPFGFLALGFALSRLPRPWSKVLLAAGVIWSLYLLPLTMALNVPAGPYGWLLSRFGL